MLRIGCVYTLFIFIYMLGISRLAAQISDGSDREIANAGSLEQIDENNTQEVIGFSEEEVRERLSYLPAGCTPLKYDRVVRAYLITYLYKKPHKTREMLARMPMWFHIFEQELKAAGMPEDLKYLAVTESALNPMAVSHCGATGLWQFMPATGREYGLEQNSAIDERSLAIESTRASLKYLKHLYNQFGDWALALAAYNSGPGNVSRAIKRAHSRNFWVIQKYLPLETRNYVPAFVSATYICNFYMMHNMMPDFPDLDLQVTAYTKIFTGVAFQEIVDATGLDFNSVIALNPGYKNYYIPGQTQGRYVILPVRVMDAFTNYMRSKGEDAISQDFSHIKFGNKGNDRYIGQQYSIVQGDHADRLAGSFGCYKSHLVAWNHLPYQYAQSGKSLLVWRPNSISHFQRIQVAAPKPTQIVAAAAASGGSSITKVTPITPLKPAQPAPSQPAKSIDPRDIALPGISSPRAVMEEDQKYVWHVVQRNESLREVAQLHNVSILDIQRLNGSEHFGIGARIKVKPK